MGVERRRWAVAAIALALVVTACSGRGDETAASVVSVAPAETATTVGVDATVDEAPSTTGAPSTSTAPVTTSTTTPAAPTDEERIDALVERYWQVVFAANNPPDPEHSGWDEVATPGLAESRRARSAENLENNFGIAPLDPDEPFNLGSVVTLVGETSAIAFHCFRDFAYAYELDTGKPLGDSTVISLVRIDARLTGDGWRVGAVDLLEHWHDGEEDECASALRSYS